jgi:hypothetical protein
VKVLQDVIEKLGDKEKRTSAESAILARALRQTGDASAVAAAKMVAADAAVRRLGDAMQDSQKKSDGLGKALGNLKPNPGLVGPILALVPALGTLTGVVAAAGAGLAGAFVAGGGAIAAFGAVAKPVLSDAMKASQAVGKAQDNYSIAIANGTKQSVAYKAEQIAIAKAYAGLSPAQIALSKQLGAMSDAWDKVKAAQTPVVAGALQPWLKSVTDLTKNLAPVIAAVAPVIKALGGQFDNLVNSAAFKGFRSFIAGTGSAAVSAGGSTIIDLVKSFMILLPKFDPLIREAVGWISRLGPAVLAWSSSKKAADDIQSFIRFFSQNGAVVGGLLQNIGGALKALAPGLTSGGAIELKVISDFFGLVAKLPASFAKPLTEVAGALLIMSKLGVLKVGVQIIGAAAKWLTGGIITLGGDSAAAAMRAAFASGGTAAAAQIRAALAGGGVAAGGAAGSAGAGAAGGTAAGGGFVAAFRAALSPALAGVVAGALIRAAGDTLSPAGTFAGRLNKQLQADGQLWSTSLLHSFTFGGLEAWMTTHFGMPVGGFLNNTIGFLSGSWGKFTGFLSGSWNQTWGAITGGAARGSKSVADSLAAAGRAADSLRTRNLVPLQGQVGQVSGGIQGLAGTIQATLLTQMRAAGAQSDSLRTRNLVPLQGEVGKVSGGVQGLAGLINPGLTGALNTGGTRANAFRTSNLGPLQGSLAATSGGVQGLQGNINTLHGKTVNVGVHGTGSGGVQVTPSTGVPGAQNYAVFFKPLARGGRIPGFGGGDILPALLEPGEAVVDKLRARAYAPVLKAMGVPGFAAGGLAGAQGAIGLGGASNAAAEARVDINAIVAAIKAAAIKAAAALTGAGGGVSGAGPVGGDAAANKALARSMFPWPASQWPAFDTLEMHEAGYNRFARNASSGAYGIPQALPPTKMPFAAQAAGGSHAGPQLAWMFSYIRSVYGTPGNAWAKYYQHPGGIGWYGGGLDAMFSRPTLIGVGERGPEHVQVTPGGGGDLGARLDRLIAEVRQLTGVAAGIPAATGRHVGGAINSAAGAASFRSRYPSGGA